MNETISVHEKANENKSISDTLASPEKLKAPHNMKKDLLDNLQTNYGWLEIKNDAFLCKLCSTLSGGIPSDRQSCRGFGVNKPVHITDHFRRSVLNHQHSNLHKANEKCLRELKRLKLTKKGGIGAQILAGSLKEKEKNTKRNHHIVKKLMKTVFFLIRKKWATRSNFESVIRFIAKELEEPDLQHHVKRNCSGNVTMMSPKTVNHFIKIISDKLDTSLLDTLKLCNYFSVLADESTSDKNDSILSIY